MSRPRRGRSDFGAGDPIDVRRRRGGLLPAVLQPPADLLHGASESARAELAPELRRILTPIGMAPAEVGQMRIEDPRLTAVRGPRGEVGGGDEVPYDAMCDAKVATDAHDRCTGSVAAFHLVVERTSPQAHVVASLPLVGTD